MEYSNPFDLIQNRFYLLENSMRQFSLWPEHCALPAGWRVVCQPAITEDCNRWLQSNWSNLQPGSFAVDGEMK